MEKQLKKEIINFLVKIDISQVLEAVKQDGWVLQYASEQLRDDPEIVLIAMQDGRDFNSFK